MLRFLRAQHTLARISHQDAEHKVEKCLSLTSCGVLFGVFRGQTGQPARCGSVGAEKVDSNHSATAGWKLDKGILRVPQKLIDYTMPPLHVCSREFTSERT